MTMNNKIREDISALLINDASKAALFSMDRMLNSQSSAIRNSTFVPLVIAGEGCGLTSFGRIFSEIINCSVYSVKGGNSNYLELVFPKDNEDDEKRFFSSPAIAASTVNRFYGSMIISLKEFEGNDLMKSGSFIKLMDFCKDNKENIHFVFHITPEFEERNRLVSELQTLFPIMEITLDKPNVEKSYEYLISEIMKNKMTIDDDAMEFLRERVIPVYVSQNDFSGFNSLNNLLCRLIYETFMTVGSEDYLISRTVLETLMVKVQTDFNVCDTPKIGFRM